MRRQKKKPDSMVSKTELAELKKQRCEMLILSGCTSQLELQQELKVSKDTIKKYIGEIRQRWIDEGSPAQHKREQAIRRIERVAYAAIQGYARSQQDTEEQVTETKNVQCSTCEGTGAGGECVVCDGSGVTPLITVKRKRKTNAGDSSFLNVARAAFSDLTKLEGTVVENDGDITINVLTNQQMDQFKNLSSEELLKIRKENRRALAGVKQENGEQVIDGTVGAVSIEEETDDDD